MLQPDNVKKSAPERWHHWFSHPLTTFQPNQIATQWQILELLNQDQELGSSELKRLGRLLLACLPVQAALALIKKSEHSDNQDELIVAFSSLSAAQTTQLLTNQLLLKVAENLPYNHLNLRLPRVAALLHRQKNVFSVIYQLRVNSKTFIWLLADRSIEKEYQPFLQLSAEILKSRQTRQELATALRSEAERLNTLTHHLSEGLLVLDQNLKIKLWNRPLQRLTGYSPLEAENQPYYEVLQRSDNPHWLETLFADYQSDPNKNVFADELEIKTKNQGRHWISLSGSFLRDFNNHITQTIVIIRDITRHKELEMRKNEFISIATHELRTPITAIKGYLSLLKKQTPELGVKASLYLNRATEANNRLIQLTEDLLQVIQVEENRLTFVRRPIHIAPTLRRVVADFQSKARRKKLSLRFEKSDLNPFILADPARLEQIFANLVDNAIKYTLKGSVTVSLVARVNRLNQEPEITIIVRDTGVGLTSKEMETIFEKFHRTEQAQRSNESGAGLGLFIVRSFVEKQGGKITVKSGPRRGSQFAVTFPVIETTAAIKNKNILERK